MADEAEDWKWPILGQCEVLILAKSVNTYTYRTVWKLVLNSDSNCH